jgi:hypothetical protein
MPPKNPLKTIKEYRDKGYVIEVSMDSVRTSYTVNMFTPKDVRKFTVPFSKVQLHDLHNAVRGL